MARIRADIALSVIVATLVGLGGQTITTKAIEATNRPSEYIKNIYTDGTVGAQADESIPRANTVDEIREQTGLFTVETDGNYHIIYGTDGFYYISLRSEDREYEEVFAKILTDSVQSKKTGEYSRVDVMPIGELVYEPIPEDVLEKAGEYRQPKYTDFYIDMYGSHEAGYWYEPVNAKVWGERAFGIITTIMFIIVRVITVKLGLFPPILPKRQK